MAEIWSVLLGGALSIGGGAITQLLQRGETKHARIATRNQLMRAKAEECHASIAVVHAACDLALYTGKDLTPTGDVPYQQKSDYRLMYALCVTYFPATADLFIACGRNSTAAMIELAQNKDLSMEETRGEVQAAIEGAVRSLCYQLTEVITEEIASRYATDLQ